MKMLVRYVVAVALLLSFAPTHVKAARQPQKPAKPTKPVVVEAPQPAFVADRDTCDRAAAAFGDFWSSSDQLAAHGDKAEALAKAFQDSGTINYDDSKAMFDATNATTDDVTAMMTAIQKIDSLFPASDDVSLQVIHLKIGLAMDPLKPYASQAIQRMMATINCDLGDGFALCQAKLVAPLYFTTRTDGTPARPYLDFRGKVEEQVTELKAFLTQMCKGEFEPPHHFMTDAKASVDADAGTNAAVAKTDAQSSSTATAPTDATASQQQQQGQGAGQSAAQ